MFTIVLSFITALALSYIVMPGIIRLCIEKQLAVPPPRPRDAHKIPTPSMGGIGIFIGTVFSIILWTPYGAAEKLQYILCGLLILFIIGVRDDIIEMAARRKLVGQLLAAGILVFKSDVLITNFQGILNIYEINYWAAAALSIFVIIVIMNSFNLIDGINGLSGGTTVLVTFFFGVWFASTAHVGLAIMAFATAGSAIAFLRYNFPKAEVFMGDSGSLVLGLIISVLTIRFIELHTDLSVDSPYYYAAAPAMAIATLILPLFDTARVFISRAIRGRSPLSPDRNHIHHLLIDSGLTHVQATFSLITVNGIFIALVVILQEMGNALLLGFILLLALGFMGALQLRVMRKRRLKNAA